MRHRCGAHPSVGPSSNLVRSLGAVRLVLCLHHPGIPCEQNSQLVSERERNSRWYGTKNVTVKHIDSP